MSIRIIYCYKCDRKVGELRDASIMRGIRYTCTYCVHQEELDENPYDLNIFGDLFGTEKAKSADFWDDLANKFKGSKK